MRRLLALLLLAAFGLPVAAPAFALATTADIHLPACCRRNGAHHCAAMMANPSSGPAFSAICPHFPQPSATSPTNASAALTSPSPNIVHLITLTATQQAETQRRISRERSRQTRGPPSLLA